MSDLARWGVRGPVRTLRVDFAEWNPEAAGWWPLKTRFVATFRPDGRISEVEYHNPDGSRPRNVRIYDDGGHLTGDQWWADGQMTTRELGSWRVDEHGRKTKVVVLEGPANGGPTCEAGSCGTMYGVEGTDAAYSAPGATTITTTYDDHERPSEATFRDAADAVVGRVTFSRDPDGRVLSERMEFTGPGGPLGQVLGADLPAEERASLEALLEAVFAEQAFSVATYAYDDKGRRVETVRRMGNLSEERVSVRYDDFDNPVEEVRSDVSREMRMEEGAVKAEEQPSHVMRTRFQYQYDPHGNWTERIVWQRMVEPDGEERPSNVERRTIEYHA